MGELTEQDKLLEELLGTERAFAEAILRRRRLEAERLQRFIENTPAGAFVTYAPTPKAKLLQKLLNAGMPLQQAMQFAELSTPTKNERGCDGCDGGAQGVDREGVRLAARCSAAVG